MASVITTCRISTILAVALLGATLTTGRAQAQPQPVSYWQGWYAGGLLGVAWTDVDYSVSTTTFSRRHTGIVGGGFLGFKRHLTETVIIGLEGDVTSGNIALTQLRCSLVGHLGRLVRPTTLIYGLAGFACGHFNADITVTSTTVTMVLDDDEELINVVSTTTGQASIDKTLWGFVLGLGVETEDEWFNRLVRWGLEYRYTNFQSWNFTVLGQNFSVDPDVHEIRFRVVFPFYSNGS